MKIAQFSKILDTVSALTSTQMTRLQAALSSAQTERNSLLAIEQARPAACRHCGSLHVVRNGTRNGLQRVLCGDCHKTSNATSNTPLSKLRHKEKFERYAQCLRDGMTVRKSAEAVSVCVNTAFRWRHRFLQNIQLHQPRQVAGLLEVDETFIRESQKGSHKMSRPSRKRGGKTKGSGRFSKDWVPVLVGRARGQAHTMDKILTKVNGIELTAALKDVVTPGETILCTDGNTAYRKLPYTLGVQTKSFTAGRARLDLDKVYHIQSANSYHERLKTWMQRGLRGVSTLHLPNYLAWMRIRSWNKEGLSPAEIIASAMGKQIINL